MKKIQVLADVNNSFNEIVKLPNFFISAIVLFTTFNNIKRGIFLEKSMLKIVKFKNNDQIEHIFDNVQGQCNDKN